MLTKHLVQPCAKKGGVGLPEMKHGFSLRNQKIKYLMEAPHESADGLTKRRFAGHAAKGINLIKQRSPINLLTGQFGARGVCKRCSDNVW